MSADDPAARLRELTTKALAEEAINFTMGRQEQVTIELQRRVIEQSARASRNLLIATWAIAVLTGVLIVLAIAELLSALD